MESKKPKINIICHPDATVARRKNAKSIVSYNNECFNIIFQIVRPKQDLEKPTACQEIIKGKIKQTSLNLSVDGAIGLYIALGEELRKNGFLNIKLKNNGKRV